MGTPRGSSPASSYTDVVVNKYLTGHDTSFSGPVGAWWSVSRRRDALDDRMYQNMHAALFDKSDARVHRYMYVLD